MNRLYSTVNSLREAVWSPSKSSNFLTTGELTPEEFVQAGDYLVYKFRTWSWSPADASKANPHLPADKQFLVTRHVPRVRKLNDLYATGAWENDGEGDEVDIPSGPTAPVQAVDDRGNVEDVVADEDDIPDMEDSDDDDEAIIRDTSASKGDSVATKEPDRTYTLYITYSNYYRTPRLYLSGYAGRTQTPLTPDEMMEDIVGDYKEKTVTIEEFPHLDGGIRMASIHPCRHASVMRLLLDRADAALKLRKRKQKAAADGSAPAEGGESRDEWEEILAEDAANSGDEEPAIRIDQYLVVFLKFAASVTPGIEHDYTMGV